MVKKRYLLKNLECANCALKMEERISKLSGVKSANINFFSTKLTMEFDEAKESEILKEAQNIISKLEPRTIFEK
ncbi:MAG: heavy-metal-associated domain-containing protein [Campylobacteraceae bacterium]|nr:heavy-metal-associated domain-containing protein [Campylobacteraceae bacterium]